MSNIAFLLLPLAFFSLPAVLPFVSPSSQVCIHLALGPRIHSSIGSFVLAISSLVFVLLLFRWSEHTNEEVNGKVVGPS